MQEADTLRSNRNKLSKQIGGLMAKGEKDEAEKVKAQVNEQSASCLLYTSGVDSVYMSSIVNDYFFVVHCACEVIVAVGEVCV